MNSYSQTKKKYINLLNNLIGGKSNLYRSIVLHNLNSVYEENFTKKTNINNAIAPPKSGHGSIFIGNNFEDVSIKRNFNVKIELQS